MLIRYTHASFIFWKLTLNPVGAPLPVQSNYEIKFTGVPGETPSTEVVEPAPLGPDVYVQRYRIAA